MKSLQLPHNCGSFCTQKQLLNRYFPSLLDNVHYEQLSTSNKDYQALSVNREQWTIRNKPAAISPQRRHHSLLSHLWGVATRSLFLGDADHAIIGTLCTDIRMTRLRIVYMSTHILYSCEQSLKMVHGREPN